MSDRHKGPPGKDHAMIRLLLFVPVLLLMTGCAALGRGHWDPFATTSERRVVVFVENYHREDVRIEAVRPGSRVRLGQVGPLSRERLAVDWSDLDDLRFQLELFSGSRFTTQGVMVAPGDAVDLSIRVPLNRSFVRRR